MKIPTFPCEGGSACGAIRYRLLEDPLSLHVCHCNDCQTITGTAFILSMIVSRSSLEVVQGPSTWTGFEKARGPEINRCCTQCCTRLWSEAADHIVLRPGTLDDISWLMPVAHMWTIRKQPWVEIPNGVLRYDKGIDDYTEVARAWKRPVSVGHKTK